MSKISDMFSARNYICSLLLLPCFGVMCRMDFVGCFQKGKLILGVLECFAFATMYLIILWILDSHYKKGKNNGKKTGKHR